MYLNSKGSSGTNSSLLVPAGYDTSHTTTTTVPTKRRTTAHPSSVPNRKANIALIVILLGLSTACLVHAWYVLGHQVERSNKSEHNLHVMADHEPKERVTPVKLSLEEQFRKTVKSCIPTLNKKCQTYIPKDTPRVAILAPPGDFGDWIFQWASKVVDTKMGSTAKMDLQLISHVPPYGYGKTHGWTKLVRVLPRSLMLGAADAIRGSLLLGQTQHDLTLNDLKAATRQLLRYQCRISHLAAHTAVLTLEMDTLARVPYIAGEGLLNFLNITAISHGEMEDPDMERKEDSDDVGRYFMRAQDVIARSNHVESFAASLLTWIEQHEQRNVKQELDQVLQDELMLSANFSKWPCDSFWTTGDGIDGLQLSAFGRRLAQSLAPDCNAPYTSCGVKKDRCEQDGDALCKK
jgi:hypothetical protein